MVRRKWVDDLKDVEGTKVCGHVSQPVPMCCRRRGDTITYLVFQIEITFRSCNAALSSSSRETSALGGDSGTILRDRSLIKRHQQALVALLSSTRLSGLDAVSQEMFPVTEELGTSVSPCALLPKTGTGHCSPGSMPGKRR